MVRLGKNARDALKAKGLWNLDRKDKYAAEAKAFAASAHEANKIEFKAGFTGMNEDVFFTHDADCFSEAWCEIIEDTSSDPFPPEINDPNYPDSFLPAQSFLVGSAFRVLNSSKSEVINFSEKFPDIPVPENQLPFLKMIGEFERGGNRMVYPSVASEVKTFLRAAVHTTDSVSAMEALKRSWLPVSSEDPRFRFILAEALADFTEDKVSVRLDPALLQNYLFSDVVPDAARRLSEFLDDGCRQDFLRLFTSYKTGGAFFRLFSTPSALAFFRDLGLSWERPSPEHLLMEKSVHELLIMVNRILPPGFVSYRGRGVRPLSSVCGPGSVSQCIRDPGDGTFTFPPGVSVEELVSGIVLKCRSIVQEGRPYAVGSLPFGVQEHFRSADVDWFNLDTLEFVD